jgi:hypothetical protein
MTGKAKAINLRSDGIANQRQQQAISTKAGAILEGL